MNDQPEPAGVSEPSEARLRLKRREPVPASSNPIVQRWWKYMADIMETNKDFSPVTVPLKEVFYLK